MAADEERPLSSEEIEVLRTHVSRDRTLASELDRQVRRVRATPSTVITPDITGRPAIARQQMDWKREKIRGLEMLDRELFFAKVDARVTTGRERDTPVCLLMTKARGVGMLEDPDEKWAVVCWTDPLVCLVDRQPGEKAEFPVPNRAPAKYLVGAVGRFDSVSPKLTGIQYDLDIGDFFLASEDDLAAPEVSVLEAPPQIEYQAAEVIGLGDIIASADGLQRAAMHLPFKAHVLIEGPPGSGKTSVGLMRIACLIDQQWEVLKLDRRSDVAFHEQATMRVLVFNEEMVDYLRTLVQSTGVQGVRVQTTRSFTLDLCRAAGTLTGRLAKDRLSVTALKSQRESLDAYWAGFRGNLAKVAPDRLADLKARLDSLGPEAGRAFRAVSDWVGHVLAAEARTGDTIPSINIAEPLARWRRDLERSIPEADKLPPMPGSNVSRQQAERMIADRDRVRASNEAAKETRSRIERTIRETKSAVSDFIHAVMDRSAIVREMFTSTAFSDLLGAAKRNGVPEERIQRGQRWWREQYEGSEPVYSEYDAIAAAWLGLRTLLVAGTELKPLVGGTLDRLTHIVIDEAQDLSPAHLALVAGMLHRDGTLSILGDIRQNLNTVGGLRNWEELGVRVERRAFQLNYRQSAELGRFVHALHQRLYAEAPVWSPTERWHGPLPRIVRANKWSQIAEAAAAECRRAKEIIPGCTIAVLYDKRLKPKRLEWLRRELDTRLADLLPTVQLVEPKSRGAQLRDTDAIVIASVAQTKGLEFDAVVFVDPQPQWTGELHELPLRLRNGLYVAASRARQFLCLLMGGIPAAIENLANEGVCEVAVADRED
jgi:superfamily I DNA/RNA helicase